MICAEIVRQHYENFPVASILLPKQLRKPISAIYSFARTADDLADEGELDAAARLNALAQYEKQFNHMLTGKNNDDPVLIALAHSITCFELTPSLFTDLISAFTQDITKKRYQNFNEVLDYCRRSANPVGRLLLQLVNKDNPHMQQLSDAVCTALQLINFYQDIGQDFDENNRIYLAADEMKASDISEEHLARRISDEKFKIFMNQQIMRAASMLSSGYPLGHQIGGRLGLELKMTIHAANRVAEKMLRERNCFTRPRLSKADWPMILFKSLFNITPKTLNGLT